MQAAYDNALNSSSDINEHISDLYDLSKQCDTILELGTRTCVSSWAFAKGLVDAAKLNELDKWLVSVDLERHPNVLRLQEALSMECDMKKIRVHHSFVEGNDLHVPLPLESFDMVFIDTWHVYGQLKRELVRFAPLAKKYIVMHDTEIDGQHGESVRCSSDIRSQSIASGFSEEEIRTGLQRAIDEFLVSSEWRVRLVKRNNNGLTVLERKFEESRPLL